VVAAFREISVQSASGNKVAPAAPLARRQRRPPALGGPGRRTPGHPSRHADQDSSHGSRTGTARRPSSSPHDCPAPCRRVNGAPYGRVARDRLRRPLTRHPFTRILAPAGKTGGGLGHAGRP
jgi:hypothetical protein